ncbi:SH3 domain-containing protein [Archangium violaceum]|uniref:SH3 domain-containing protein n=1 Tax=Archangium violaceum TaxID=83451 RepID=UPI00193BD8DB|nr:SH3 domain-containing protein [Archangium violaceum]QRK12428.1 SH3 domain-containing protein [Archangium violaceum]
MDVRMAVLGGILSLAVGCSGASGDAVENAELKGADETVPAPEHALSGCVSAQARLETTAPLNLRQGPSTDAPILLTLPAGAELSLAAEPCPDNGFYKVRFGGFEGWAYGAWLGSGTLSSALSSANSRDDAIARARAGVGFSYWWGHGRFLPQGPSSSTRGSCAGSCPDCSHSGSYGGDCSGYAAKVWVVPSTNTDLTKDSHPYSTAVFNTAYHGWHNVQLGSIQKADALVYNSGGAGHIFIYEKGDPWGSMYAYECRGCADGCVYGLRRAGSAYKAISRDGIQSCSVGGAILTRYNELGGAGGVLGSCTTSEMTTPDGVGRYNHFQNGSIYWTQETGAWDVRGLIRAKWEALGWENGVLGYPTTGEMVTPDGVGRYNHFRKGGVLGSIYWTQETGAWEVHGVIRDKWAALGWEKSVLGYPITDEMKTPDGVGRYNHFRKGGVLGSIYWTPATGVHEVHGVIREKWAALGWENGVLGYPITDEMVTPDGVGRYNHFRKGNTEGSIYWTPATGVHAVHGVIREKWKALGWETGSLGYPVSDEYPVATGRESEFQKGFITYSSSTGAVSVRMK